MRSGDGESPTFGRLGDGRWCPPFDIGPIDHAPPTTPCRYADLRAVVAVVHLGAPIAAHELDFAGGELIRHRLVTDDIERLEHEVAVSLGWPSYLRCGAAPRSASLKPPA